MRPVEGECDHIVTGGNCKADTIVDFESKQVLIGVPLEIASVLGKSRFSFLAPFIRIKGD